MVGKARKRQVAPHSMRQTSSGRSVENGVGVTHEVAPARAFAASLSRSRPAFT